MELKRFSWSASEFKSGAKNVTYCFKYEIGVANPYYIFYALADNKAVATSCLGNPIKTSLVEVLLNGKPTEIDDVGANSFNYNHGLCLRLKDSRVAVGSTVEVILKGIRNKSIPGKYRWKWIATANDQGIPIEEVTKGNRIVLI